MWISAAGAALSFFSSNKKAKEDKKATKEQTLMEISGARQNSQFDAEQAYYYQQLGREEKMRGLDEFRKFSTVQSFAPGYTNTNPNPIVIPTKPEYNQGTYSTLSIPKTTNS